jgi:hypothetical protein
VVRERGGAVDVSRVLAELEQKEKAKFVDMRFQPSVF